MNSITKSKRSLKADTLFQSVSVAVLLAIVCRLVGFGRGIVLTRMLSPEQLGTWALIANATALLAFLCTLGLPSGLARYTERFRGGGHLSNLLLTTLLRAGVVTIVVCALASFLWPSTGGLLFGDQSNAALVWITLGAVAATVLLSLVQGILQGLRLFRLNSALELAQNLSFLLLVVVLFGCFTASAYLAAWASLLTTFVVALLVGFWIYRRMDTSGQLATPEASSTPMLWWPVLTYSLGAWGAGSLQALWRVIDRYMLLHLSSASAAETLDQIGQYYIASKMGGPLGALAGVVSMALLPHAAKLWESGKRQEVCHIVRAATKLLILMMTFGGALLLALKYWLIPLVVGRDAMLTIAIFGPVLLTVIAVSVHFMLRTYLMCHEKPWSVTWIWVVTLAANAGLNCLLIPRYQLLGADWATMLSGGLAVALTTLCSHWTGMAIGRRLVLCLCLPAVLLLPPVGMTALLFLVALATHFTDWILNEQEKQLINQTCADRMGRIFKAANGATPDPVAA